MKKSQSSHGLFSFLKFDLFWLILFFCLALAGVDYWSLTEFGKLSMEIRSAISLLILVTASLFIEEVFIFWAFAILFPNLALIFYLSIKMGNINIFFLACLSEALVILLAGLFHWRLTKSFMPEESFGKMKKELKEHKDNSHARILYFSLMGCLRDKNKVISQAYHILESCFKAEKSMLFLANYQTNQLVPSPKPGDRYSEKVSPIMVNPTFWKSEAYDPEKGVLSVINGQANIPSLRQLIPGANFEALAAMPISAENKVIGLMTIIRQKPENREFLDPSLFVTFANVLGSSLDNCSVHDFRSKMLDSAEKKSDMIENAFGKYVSKSIVDELINNKETAIVGGKKKNVSILMADLRGFTALSSIMPMEKLVALLNSWFEIATQLILKSNGTIDKYMGDCVMVIFGAPIEKRDDVLRSVYTAFRLQEKFIEFLATAELPENGTLGLGVSITSGKAIVGNFGSSNRMEYTAIGETVNLCARLEKLAGAGEIVVDSTTFDQIPQEKFKYIFENDVPIKGLANQSIYRLQEVLRNKLSQ